MVKMSQSKASTVFSLRHFSKKNKRSSAVVIDLDALEGMVQSYTPDVGLVLTMIFQVNVNGFF